MRADRLVLVLLFVLTGCLPSSCRREESRALFPADSLSRIAAEAAPVDTLRADWDYGEGFEHPRTVLWGEDGRLYVSDVERDAVFAFSPTGTLERTIALPELPVPYLAGLRGDTLVVFSPEARTLGFVHGGAVVRTVPTPNDLPEAGRLQYAAVTDTALYVKLLSDDADGYVAALGPDGSVRGRTPLTGPAWRHAGFLRTWGDSLVSLAGFRPDVVVLPPALGAADTLALRGFDSPMLNRRRLFALGEVDEAPLLTSSAAAAGGRLFVLNLRPGWLRVDVYDRQGHLERLLVQPNPGYDAGAFSVDLAARRRADGSYVFAVVTTGRRPAVNVYEWGG